MKNITWKEAIDVVSNYKLSDKIIFISFVDKTCPTCAELVPLIDACVDESFEYYVVEDGYQMPFPPTAYPVSYVFIPNIPTEMPIMKVGAAPADIITQDVKAQKQSMKTGRDYYEVSREY